MNEKGIQDAIGLKKTLQTSFGTQTPGEVPKKDQGTQCGMAKGSYARDKSKHDICHISGDMMT